MTHLPSPVEKEEVMGLLGAEGPDFQDLLARAGRIGFMRRQNRIKLCAIVNAKSGDCNERCAFCAQSVHHDSETPVYAFIEKETILETASRAVAAGASRFSIVASGGRLSNSDVDRTAQALEALRKTFPDIHRCASLGDISLKSLRILKDAGLQRYHHNLETSRRLHDSIAPTRTYSAKIEVIKRAQELGLEVCAGGIIGMGEERKDVIEFAEEIAELKVDAFPLNYLDPRPGTPLADRKPMPAFDAIRVTAAIRLLTPESELIICGGRSRVLGHYQPLLLFCGIDGIMVGDYLTTRGANILDDKEFIEGLKFEIDMC